MQYPAICIRLSIFRHWWGKKSTYIVIKKKNSSECNGKKKKKRGCKLRVWSHHITTPLLTKQWWLEIITGCVMVTTLDIIVQHPLNQYDTDCTTALHIEPTILLCLCYCCWFSYCWLWNFFVVLLWAWISTPVERIKVSALVYSFALVLSMGIPIDKPLSLINIAKKKKH